MIKIFRYVQTVRIDSTIQYMNYTIVFLAQIGYIYFCTHYRRIYGKFFLRFVSIGYKLEKLSKGTNFNLVINITTRCGLELSIKC